MYKNSTADSRVRSSGCTLCGAPKGLGSSSYCDGCGMLVELVADVGTISPGDLALDRYDTCIYVIGFKADRDGPVKVGWSRNVLKRLRSLQAANPNELEVVAVMRTNRALDAEKLLHEYLHDSRVLGEWFRRTDRVEKLIRLMQERSGAGVLEALAGRQTDNQ